MRLGWFSFLAAVSASSDTVALELSSISPGINDWTTPIVGPSLADVTLLLAASLASQARERVTAESSTVSIPAEIQPLITQIISISLAASADPTVAKALVKDAALKAAAGQLMVLQASLPSTLQDALDDIADLGLAVAANSDNAAELVCNTALSYAKERGGATGAAVAAEVNDLLTKAQTRQEFAADMTLILVPEGLKQAKLKLPAKYHDDLEVLGSLAQKIALSPQSARTILAEAVKTAVLTAAGAAAVKHLDGQAETAALEALEAVRTAKTKEELAKNLAEVAGANAEKFAEEKLGKDAGEAIGGLVNDLRSENLISTGVSGTHLGLGPAELQLTNWGKATRACLRCVPLCFKMTHGRIKGEAGVILDVVGDIVVDLSAKTLLQFMYFDMRSEMVEASKALVAIDKRTKPRTFATYKPYNSEQLSQDVNHFVVARVKRVLAEYEIRKRQHPEAVVLLETTVPLAELKKLRNQLDVFLNEEDHGDLMLDWPQMFAISKRRVDEVAIALEQMMTAEIQGGCVFSCCGGYWVKGKKTSDGAVVPLGDTAVTLKVSHDDRLGRAVSKAAAQHKATKERLAKADSQTL